MKPLEQKRCSNCSGSFACGPETGQERCWCDHLPHVSLAVAEDQDCLCPKCLPVAIEKLQVTSNSADDAAPQADLRWPYALIEGEDYYSEGAAIVFTARYHLRRGYCCENNCRHCPYGLAATQDKGPAEK